MKQFANLLIGLFLLVFIGNSATFGANDESNQGRMIFEAFCISCHGLNGAGDGPMAETMVPRPANFQDQLAVGSLTRQDIERAIVVGKPGTEMNGFSNVLTGQDFENLLEYVDSLIARK